MKCPYCNEDVDHVIQTATREITSEITLKSDESGSYLHWEDVDDVYCEDERYFCPKCYQELYANEDILYFAFLGLEPPEWRL